MNYHIRFTEAASNYIQKMVEKDKGKGLRLTIKKTGCSGYAFQPSVIIEPNPLDFIIEEANGLKIFIDKTWLHFFEEVEVDYIEEKSGLKQKRLVFHHPASNRCGCGESFHIE